MNNKTIYQLRKQGYKVRVIHERDEIDVPTLSGIRKFLNARGGKTTIELTTPEGKTSKGIAICSEKDNFCRRIGNQVALGRAFENLQN
jgi:hypothetical protein